MTPKEQKPKAGRAKDPDSDDIRRVTKDMQGPMGDYYRWLADHLDEEAESWGRFRRDQQEGRGEGELST